MSSEFALSEDRLAILEAADRYGREQLAPLARRMDDEEWWPDEAFRGLGAEGYLGITVPEALGGAGLDFFSAGLVLQGFSRWNYALGLSWVAHENLCLNNILRNGSREQVERFIPGLSDGTLIGCLGLTEPGAGSDALGSMATTAVRDGDDYIVNGRKLFITNGPVADICLLYVKTDMEKGSQGITALIVEMDRPGATVAQKIVKMGFRGSPTGELAFDDCRVPVANVVGRKNEGVKCVMSGLDLERAAIAPICVGMAERALELSIEHARERVQFGEPIANFQMIQARLAEMSGLVETMRVYNYFALAALNDLPAGEGGRGAVHRISATSVMYASESLNRVLDHAAQIHGGVAYVWETEINRLYRGIKMLEIGAGTTEIRKLIIAKELLR
ncbi:MAG: acyl-CoA dehydrogenase family protein [Myxococcales bacterium]|nr:isovaleryl-CoA dehydrogenase [Myxococcales bacterium]HIK84215.1 isovaleryl-CoA dehydrogenase [Myxococcales bacterium]